MGVEEKQVLPRSRRLTCGVLLRIVGAMREHIVLVSYGVDGQVWRPMNYLALLTTVGLLERRVEMVI